MNNEYLTRDGGSMNVTFILGLFAVFVCGEVYLLGPNYKVENIEINCKLYSVEQLEHVALGGYSATLLNFSRATPLELENLPFELYSSVATEEQLEQLDKKLKHIIANNNKRTSNTLKQIHNVVTNRIRRVRSSTGPVNRKIRQSSQTTCSAPPKQNLIPGIKLGRTSALSNQYTRAVPNTQRQNFLDSTLLRPTAKEFVPFAKQNSDVKMEIDNGKDETEPRCQDRFKTTDPIPIPFLQAHRRRTSSTTNVKLAVQDFISKNADRFAPKCPQNVRKIEPMPFVNPTFNLNEFADSTFEYKEYADSSPDLSENIKDTEVLTCIMDPRSNYHDCFTDPESSYHPPGQFDPMSHDNFRFSPEPTLENTIEYTPRTDLPFPPSAPIQIPPRNNNSRVWRPSAQLP